MKLLLWTGNGIFIDSFGGAERVACNMGNEFLRRGWEVTIVCNDIKAGLPAYPLDKEIRLINLNGTGERLAKAPPLLKVAREITRPLRHIGFTYFIDRCEAAKSRFFLEHLESVVRKSRPDVVVPFFINDLLAFCQCPSSHRIPIVQMLHDTPEIAVGPENTAVRRALDRTAAVQVLMESFVPGIRQRCSAETVVIPNAVPQYEEHLDHREKESYRIINIARLEPKQKRQHLLIDAFALLASDFPNWTLHFYGTDVGGDYQTRLKNQIERLGMTNRVFLEGTTDRVRDAMLSADIFAFPSKHEGFGIALVEAMGVGLPAVGFRSTPAVNEMIHDGENGVLTEDGVRAFAEGLRSLMKDRGWRTRLGENGRLFARQFESRRVWDQWESLLKSVIERHPVRGWR